MKMSFNQARSVVACLGELLEIFQEVEDAEVIINILHAVIDDLTIKIVDDFTIKKVVTDE